MADISKIKALDGVTYNLKDANAAKIVELTQAEYDALATKDPDTIYMITDANDYNADKTDVTLYAANWSDGVYTISDNHIGTDTVQLVSPREGITDTQLEALQGANIQAYGQDEGHLYLKAYGDVPSIDVPVSVIYHPGVQVRDVEPQKQDIYSTTEQVVGTWIDGKPIYRKAGYLSSVGSGEIVLDSGLTSDYALSIIKVGGSCKDTSNTIMPVSGYVNGTSRVVIAVTSTGLKLFDNHPSVSNLTWLVEYTKTTD